jgi:hypothetical protein
MALIQRKQAGARAAAQTSSQHARPRTPELAGPDGAGLEGAGDLGWDSTPILDRLAHLIPGAGGEVPVEEGGDALADAGANAAATPGGVVLPNGPPPDETVLAEEVVHWAQLGLGGGGGAATSDPNDPAELEAAFIANQVAHGEAPDAPRQRATGRLMRNTGDDLQRKLDQIRRAARTTSSELYAELSSVLYVTDSVVRSLVARYFRQVRDIDRGEYFVDQARRLLQEAYADVGGPLQSAIQAGLDAETAAEVLGWITVRGVAAPAPPTQARPEDRATAQDDARAASPDRATGGGAATGGETATAAGGERRAWPDGLSDQVKAAIQTWADAASRGLKSKLRDSLFVVDADVLADLRSFRASVAQELDACPDEVTDREAAVRWAVRCLRHTYGRLTNHALVTDIEAGLELASEAEALTLVHARASGRATVRTAGASAPEAGETTPDEDAANETAAPALLALHAAVEALPTGGSVDQVDREYDRVLDAYTQHRVSRDRARALARAAYQARFHIDLTHHLREGAGDDRGRATDLTRRLGLPVDQVAAPEAVDPALAEERATTELRSRVHELGQAIEALYASNKDAAAIGPVDSAHETLLYAAERRGVPRARAVALLEATYREVEGRGLVAQLVEACRGDQAFADQVGARLGLRLAVRVATDTPEGRAEARDRLNAALDRHVPRMHAEIGELRQAALTAGFQVDDIDAVWEEVVAAGRLVGVEGAALRQRFSERYQARYGVPVATALSLACESNASYAEQLSQRTGFVVRVVDPLSLDRDVQPGDTTARDTVLLALRDALAETIVEDDHVLRLCRQLRSALRQQVAAQGTRGERVATEREALAEAIVAYQDRFGEPLQTRIRARVADEGKERECMTLIGAREDTTERLVTAEIGQDAGGDLALVEFELTQLSEALRAVAEDIASYTTLAPFATAPVSRGVRAGIDRYVEVHNEYRQNEHLSSRLSTRAPSRRILVQHYAAIEGDLLADIETYCFQADANAAFAALGLGNRSAAAALRAAGHDEAADISTEEPAERARLAISGLTAELFREVEEMRRATFQSVDVVDIDAVWDRVMEAGREGGLDAAATRSAFQAAYLRNHHIDLVAHLGIGCAGDAAIAANLTRRLGMTIQVTAGRSQVADRSAEVDVGTSGLSPEEARRLAVRLHRALLAGDEDQVQSILAHDRSAEERAVIRRAYDATFAQPLDFMLQSAFHTDAAALERVNALASADTRLNLAAELRTYASQGDRNRVFTLCMEASDSDKRALLGDAALMGQLQAAFSQEDYERIRNTLSGHLDVDDLVETRDTGGALYNLGFGTQTEELTGDLQAFVRMRRARVEADVRENEATYRTQAAEALFSGRAPATAAERARLRARTDELMDAEIDRRMRAIVREVSADPDTVAQLERELGGTELLTAQLTLSDTDGELSAYQEVLADPTRDDIIAKLEACSDEERSTLRANADFMTRLRGNGADTYQHAVRILDGDGELGAIEAALTGLDTDEHAIFTNLADMDADGMYGATQDPALLARIRSNLDGDAADGDSERGLFEDMVDEMEGLTPLGADATVAERRARLQQQLVIRHTFTLRSGIQSGREDTLRAAQSCFAERGTFTPNPDDPQTTEQVFGVEQRRAVLLAVEPDLLASYSGSFNEAFTLDEQVTARTTDVDRFGVHEGVQQTHNEFVHAVRQAILGTDDPATYRLMRGVRGIDTDEENITDAITNASPETLARSWSNIVRAPHRGARRLVDVVRDWIAAGRPEQGALREAMVDFRLDVSEDCHRHLRDAGAAGEAELLNRMRAVRAKILALQPSVVVAALREVGGLDVQDADTELIMGEDRVARSRLTHDLDDFHHQLDGWSATDVFTHTDEGVRVSAQQYTGEFNAGLEDGTLSREELEAIGDRREDFQEAVTAYREAKQAAADVAKGIAIAVIGAVATALTGPGGPTLMIAMATAGSQAAVAAVLEEAFRGRDYEMVQEGMRDVIRDVALAGLTHGMGDWFQGALDGDGILGQAGDLAQRAQALRTSLEQSAGTSSVRMFQHAMLEGVIDATSGVASDASEDMLATLRPGAWVDGFRQGLTRQSASLARSVQAWPEEWVQAFGTSVFAAYTDRLIDGATPEFEAEDGTNPLRAGLETSARNLDRAALTQARDFVAEEAGGAARQAARGEDVEALEGSHWQGEQVGEQLREIGTDRASDALSQTASATAAGRNRRAAEAWMDGAEGRRALAAVPRPHGMTDAQLRALAQREILANGVPEAGSSPISGRTRRQLARVDQLVQQNLRARRPPMTAFEQREYLEYVYAGSPTAMEARARGGDHEGRLTRPIPDPEVEVSGPGDEAVTEPRAEPARVRVATAQDDPAEAEAEAEVEAESGREPRSRQAAP